jgi:phosphohistidine phosphatase
MKVLTLLRHAKAVEATISQSDHERPLRERGIRSAIWVGRDTAAQIPDLVLCSTSARTRESFTALAQGWGKSPPVRYERELYLADADRLRRRIEQLDAAIGSVWLIGHNPGLHDLARHLAEGAQGRQGFPGLAAHFPTAARAAFAIDSGAWRDFASAPVTLAGFTVPPAA